MTKKKTRTLWYLKESPSELLAVMKWIFLFLCSLMLVAICAWNHYRLILVNTPLTAILNEHYNVSIFNDDWVRIYKTKATYDTSVNYYIYDTNNTDVDFTHFVKEESDVFVENFQRYIDYIRQNQGIDEEMVYDFETSYQWCWLERTSSQKHIFYSDDPEYFMGQLYALNKVFMVYEEDTSLMYLIVNDSR